MADAKELALSVLINDPQLAPYKQQFDELTRMLETRNGNISAAQAKIEVQTADLTALSDAIEATAQPTAAAA